MIHDQITGFFTADQRYNLRHPEKRRETNLRWRIKNKEKILKYQKQYYQKNAYKKKLKSITMTEGARLLSRISIEPIYAGYYNDPNL